MSSLRLAGPAPLLHANSSPVSWAPSSIDLTEMTLATPFDIVALATIWMRLVEGGSRPEVALPKDLDTRASLMEAGLADLIPGAWGAIGPAGARGQPVIRLTRVLAPEDWDDIAVEVMPGVYAVLGEPELAKRTFSILSELIDNATTHGQSAAGTFVCAWRLPAGNEGIAPGLHLAVADAGTGIPAHLRLNPQYRPIADDEELIRRARQPGVTGTRDRRGWGLVEVFDEATETDSSEVLIRSGRGEGVFRLRSGAPLYARYRGGLRPTIPGTWAHVRIGTP
jgi:hypothetical protein